jgi:hypothetical protein
MGGGSLTIIGRRTANVSYLHGILRAKEYQIGSAYRKWLCLYCCVWPNFATFDVFHIHAAGLGTTSTIFQYLAAGCSRWVKKLKQ